MKFWDSSAIVPLVFQETMSDETLALYRSDNRLLVWTLTSTEVFSALCRRMREGSITSTVWKVSNQRLQALAEDWSEVHAIALVKQKAERLLRVHALRAADALQLGAALLATQEHPHGFSFVTYDHHLALAADKEGFTVLPSY